MENSKSLSPQESLTLITDTINKAKENFKEDSFYYLVWGWLISIACIAHYVILNYITIRINYLPWLIIVPLGWAITITYSIKREKKKPYETYIGQFMKYLWIVLGVSFLISVFFSIKLKIHPSIFVMLLGGIGTLISGLIINFKPFIIGGILFFAFSIISVFIPFSYLLLINAVAVICGYLIPAYLLRKL